MKSDPLVGQNVEIRSAGGIAYHGIVRSIEPDDVLGELFELGSDDDPDYQRFVFVADRRIQIRLR